MTGIVVLPSVIVPKGIVLAGLSGVHSRQNERSRNQGGFGTVNVIRDVTLRAWQVGTGPMDLALSEQLFGIYEVTDAGAYAMLYEDPIDSTFSVGNGALQGYLAGDEFGAVGFGNGTPNYGVRKIYTARGSALTRARALTRFIATPSLFRGGSPVTMGAAPGNAAVSAGPSYVIFVADASRTVTAVAVGATTQVTLATSIPGFVVGGRLWLQDLAGADAALLNNLSHEITAITGGGLNVYTLATNTAGKTITAAGTGKKYPQPDETLTCAGSFFVPVQFRDDNLNWDLAIAGPTNRRQVVIPACFIDEIREA
ncbi:hypothetical protein [Variovorax boronicumulans]|uniref:hypothetical protein n=1 Tax=Variovorax boronicumulans TaxID=436515 RepID=UPI0012E4E99C|nr:hypothetical protein [Variovorax boronicumulans]GER21452.1 hypothetical protein VCH24_65040 [Variovorax boronicumulans]